MYNSWYWQNDVRRGALNVSFFMSYDHLQASLMIFQSHIYYLWQAFSLVGLCVMPHNNLIKCH